MHRELSIVPFIEWLECSTVLVSIVVDILIIVNSVVPVRYIACKILIDQCSQWIFFMQTQQRFQMNSIYSSGWAVFVAELMQFVAVMSNHFDF